MAGRHFPATKASHVTKATSALRGAGALQADEGWGGRGVLAEQVGLPTKHTHTLSVTEAGWMLSPMLRGPEYMACPSCSHMGGNIPVSIRDKILSWGVQTYQQPCIYYILYIYNIYILYTDLIFEKKSTFETEEVLYQLG